MGGVFMDYLDYLVKAREHFNEDIDDNTNLEDIYITTDDMADFLETCGLDSTYLISVRDNLRLDMSFHHIYHSYFI
jgi:hypothetical protein